MPHAPSRDFTDASRGERLQRVLADAGVGSRRACEELIEAGEVEVNGQVVSELPAWVDPEEDRIVVEGRPLPRPERKLYVLLNKPARTLSTAKDEPGADRRTVTDLVDHPGASRLFPVGRLDYDTVGLILLTNDGELANRLTHPRYGVPKTYRVVVKGVLGEDAGAELERGIFLAQRKAGETVGGERTAGVEIKVLSQSRSNTTLEMTLREGRNRQVRRMLAAVGYPVKTLERIGMGPLRLKGVQRGAWRELTRDEVWALKRSAADARPDGEAEEAGGARNNAGASKKRPGARKPAPKKPAPKKAGPRKKAGGAQRTAYEPKPLDPGAPIRRRTMKNAINRAAEGGQSRPPGPRRGVAAEPEPGQTDAARPKNPARAEARDQPGAGAPRAGAPRGKAAPSGTRAGKKSGPKPADRREAPDDAGPRAPTPRGRRQDRGPGTKPGGRRR
jgi:pseudouridine synthase